MRWPTPLVLHPTLAVTAVPAPRILRKSRLLTPPAAAAASGSTVALTASASMGGCGNHSRDTRHWRGRLEMACAAIEARPVPGIAQRRSDIEAHGSAQRGRRGAAGRRRWGRPQVGLRAGSLRPVVTRRTRRRVTLGRTVPVHVAVEAPAHVE